MKKRLFLSLFCLLLLPVFCGCKSSSPYLAATSELTEKIYFGETESYTVTAQTGKREDPYVSDGVKGETYPFFHLTVKVKGECSLGEEFGVSATLNGETYACDLTFSPLGEKLTGALPVKAPVGDTSVALTVYRGGESQTVTLTCPATVCAYEEALSSAVNTLGKDVARHLKNGKFQGEIHARLIRVQSVTYWFITFIPLEGESCSVLADAATGEVLAVKGVTPSVTPPPAN